MSAAWLRAARPLAHANIAPPILLGQAIAFAQGFGFDPVLAVIAHSFGVLDHLFIVFANDVADREADALNEAPTPFSGGSRVLQEGLLRPRQLGWAAVLAALAPCALSAVAAVFFDRPLTPAFALAAIALLAAYSFAPLRLAYRGYGELCQGLGVGLVLPLLGFYLQSGRIELGTWLAPLVLLGVVSNIVTALPDTPADRAANKRTWPVRCGEPSARVHALVLLAVGLVLAALLTPALSRGERALVLVLPLVFVLGALAFVRRAGLRFVFFAGGAITLLHLAWSAALFASG